MFLNNYNNFIEIYYLFTLMIYKLNDIFVHILTPTTAQDLICFINALSSQEMDLMFLATGHPSSKY